VLARDDDGDGAAIRRDGKIAKAEAVKNGDGCGLRDGDFMICWDWRKRRKVDPDEIAGFSFQSTLQDDPRFVRRPAKDSEANAETCHAIGRSEIANFENFLVDEIGNFFPAGRYAEAAFVVLERGQLFVVIGEEIEALEAGRAVHGAILLDTYDGNRSWNGRDIAESAAIVRRFDGADINARGLQGEKLAGLHGFGESGDGDVVGKKERIGGVQDDVLAFVDADFPAGIIVDHGLERVFRLAAIIEDRGGEEHREEEMAVGRPAEPVDQIAENLRAARVFLSFKETTAFSAEVLDPDVVVLERVVDFCFHPAIDGVDNAAVGGVREGGDIFVDGLERFVEILGAGSGKGTAAGEKTEQRAKLAEPPEAAASAGASHGFGCGPVYSEQQGFCVGVNSINSTRVSSGS